MEFRIKTRIGSRETLDEIVDVKAAVDAIENWQSRFTDRPRTRYGLKITTQYVEALVLGETGRFDQPMVGGMKERFEIARVG